MKWREQSPKLGIHSDYKYLKKRVRIKETGRKYSSRRLMLMFGWVMGFFVCNLVILSL